MNSWKHLHVKADKRPLERGAEHPVRASMARAIFVLLTLALALCVAPFAPGERSHRELGKRTLTSPTSLLDRARKEQQLQMTADSAKNRLQSAKQAESPPAAPIQTIPSGIDCDNAPGIVIHDDG